MTIVLNHTIVPARDKVAAARFFADIFGLPFDAESGHFAPVRVNDGLTFLFDDDASFEVTTMHSTSAMPSSTPSSSVSSRRGSHTAAPPGVSTMASSMTGTAAAASISKTRTATYSSS